MANEVKNLSEQIKVLIGDIDTSVSHVEDGTEKLSQSIQCSKDALKILWPIPKNRMNGLRSVL